METVKRSVVARGWDGEGCVGREQGIFRAILLSKPIECTIPGVNSNVNYGLWLTMMCQCKFTDFVAKVPSGGS